MRAESNAMDKFIDEHAGGYLRMPSDTKSAAVESSETLYAAALRARQSDIPLTPDATIISSQAIQDVIGIYLHANDRIKKHLLRAQLYCKCIIRAEQDDPKYSPDFYKKVARFCEWRRNNFKKEGLFCVKDDTAYATLLNRILTRESSDISGIDALEIRVIYNSANESIYCKKGLMPPYNLPEVRERVTARHYRARRFSVPEMDTPARIRAKASTGTRTLENFEEILKRDICFILARNFESDIKRSLEPFAKSAGDVACSTADAYARAVVSALRSAMNALSITLDSYENDESIRVVLAKQGYVLLRAVQDVTLNDKLSAEEVLRITNALNQSNAIIANPTVDKLQPYIELTAQILSGQRNNLKAGVGVVMLGLSILLVTSLIAVTHGAAIPFIMPMVIKVGIALLSSLHLGGAIAASAGIAGVGTLLIYSGREKGVKKAMGLFSKKLSSTQKVEFLAWFKSRVF